LRQKLRIKFLKNLKNLQIKNKKNKKMKMVKKIKKYFCPECNRRLKKIGTQHSTFFCRECNSGFYEFETIKNNGQVKMFENIKISSTGPVEN